MNNSFFQALDMIHIWADTQKLPIAISKNEIFVSCATDLSLDAEKICDFISFILKKRWSYRMLRESEEYKFIFHETDQKNSLLPPNRKKQKKAATSTNVNGLFD